MTDTQVTWLTQESHDRLKTELDQLIANRPVIAAEINDRRESLLRAERQLAAIRAPRHRDQNVQKLTVARHLAGQGRSPPPRQ